MALTIKVGKDGFIKLSEFKTLIPVSKVKYYSIKENKNKTLSLKFYDRNKKLIKSKI